MDMYRRKQVPSETKKDVSARILTGRDPCCRRLSIPRSGIANDGVSSDSQSHLVCQYPAPTSTTVVAAVVLARQPASRPPNSPAEPVTTLASIYPYDPVVQTKLTGVVKPAGSAS